MVDIKKAFDTNPKSLASLFHEPGVAYYIPLYQREYSWDAENVEKLFEDICRGVTALIDRPEKDKIIRFLGTVILVTEKDKSAIRPQDKTALPTRIDKIIDGQQRISTVALLSCILYQLIETEGRLIPSDDSSYKGLNEAKLRYLRDLLNVFSVDLSRGNPERKPIVIRGKEDQWTLDGSVSFYQSPVASFIAKFIEAIAGSPTTTTIVYPAADNANLGILSIIAGAAADSRARVW